MASSSLITRLGAAAWLLALLVSVPASAEGAGKENTADELYRRGLAAFEAGNYKDACPALAESYRLDPLPGALFTVATCELRAGRVATAFQRFGDYIALVDGLAPELKAQQQTRRGVADQQRHDLIPDIPYIRVVVGEGASATDIRLNGVVLGPESLGVDLPVDPGEQIVKQDSANGKSHVQRVLLGKGERKTVSLAVLNDQPSAAARPAPHVEPSRRSSLSGSHALAYTMVGIGVAGIGVGSVAGILAVNARSVVSDQCNGSSCSLKGKEAADSGKADGLVSTIGFGVGIAGLAIGGIMLLSSPRPAPVATRTAFPVISLSPRSVTVSGAF